MRRDVVEVTVEAFEGGVPMYRAAISNAASDVYLYQRDDGAWRAVFPADAPSVETPACPGAIDLPALVAELFPELVR